MKTIKYDNYNGDGVFINLDISYIPYQKLIYEPEKYLNKNQRYYFYCEHGYKSGVVVKTLIAKGYFAIQVIK